MTEPLVKLHLLGDVQERGEKGGFWIDWCENRRTIEKSALIEGDDVREIIESLSSHLLSRDAGNLCDHSPAYGIIARDEQGRILTTSLCFSCSSWVRPKRRLKISGGYGINNPLCLVLRKHLELPSHVLDSAKQEAEEEAAREAEKQEKAATEEAKEEGASPSSR